MCLGSDKGRGSSDAAAKSTNQERIKDWESRTKSAFLHRKFHGNIRGNPFSTECLLKMYVVNS